MNFSKFLSTLAIAAATVIAPAQAYTGNEVTPGQEALFKAVYAAGGTIDVGSCEEDDAFGWFQPAEKRIVVCTNVAETVAQRYETLRHEAVHLAQRCRVPNSRETLFAHKLLFNNGSQQDWSFIQKAYRPESHMIELEAFTLMRESNQAIATIVNKACN